MCLFKLSQQTRTAELGADETIYRLQSMNFVLASKDLRRNWPDEKTECNRMSDTRFFYKKIIILPEPQLS